MTTDTIGGVWRFTQELASGLLEEGCDISLVSFGSKPSPAQSAWAEEVEIAWPGRFRFIPTGIPLEWMQSNKDAYEPSARLLLHLVGSLHIDIIHSSQFCFGALKTPVPKVITAHSDVVSWAASCRSQPLESSAWLDRYRALVSAGLLGADAVAAPTGWMLNGLEENFHLHCAKHVIPNCRSIVSTPALSWKLQAVTAGRLWDEAKNVAMLANVHSPFPIFAAGETYRDSSGTFASPGVHLLGPLPEEELLSLFHESAVYICTSMYEPFGLAPLEAALCGCAILTNDIPSLREVWQDAALYFTDSVSLTTPLTQLSSDTNLLAVSRSRSMQHARTFSRGKTAGAYLGLFKEVIDQARTRKMANVA